MTLKYDSQEILQTLRGNLDLKKKVFVYNFSVLEYKSFKNIVQKFADRDANSLYYPKGQLKKISNRIFPRELQRGVL